jgi:hypothetical protein
VGKYLHFFGKEIICIVFIFPVSVLGIKDTGPLYSQNYWTGWAESSSSRPKTGCLRCWRGRLDLEQSSTSHSQSAGQPRRAIPPPATPNPNPPFPNPRASPPSSVGGSSAESRPGAASLRLRQEAQSAAGSRASTTR